MADDSHRALFYISLIILRDKYTLGLDVKTLLITFSYVHILQAIGLIYVRRIHQNYSPTLLWAVGSCAIAAGTTLSVSRDAIPLAIAIIGGQFFISAGLIIFNSGIVSACDRKPPWKSAALFHGIYNLVLIWFTIVDSNMGIRTALLSILITTTNGYSILTIIRYPSSPLKTSLGILAGLQVVEILMTNIRSLNLAIIGYDHLFQNNLIEVGFALTLITTTFMTAFVLATFTSQRLQIELHHAARHDSLTGLYNRRAFAELADREWLRAARHSESTAILFLDVYYFKGLNDQFGHHIGDIVLKETTTCIQKIMRGEDILCRYGGEEFIAFLVDTTLSQATSLAERLRLSVADLHIPEIADFNLSISIGVAIKNTDHSTWDQLVTAADVALYQAKHDGRNRVCVYTPQTV